MESFIENASTGNILPQMPSAQWRKEHGTTAPPYGWEEGMVVPKPSIKKIWSSLIPKD
jgi:hypothetical protein